MMICKRIQTIRYFYSKLRPHHDSGKKFYLYNQNTFAQALVKAMKIFDIKKSAGYGKHARVKM